MVLLVALKGYSQCSFPPPNVTISNKVGICLGTSVTLNATYLADYTYLWELDGGIAQGPTDQNQITVVWNSIGQKSISVTAISNICGPIFNKVANKVLTVIDNSDYSLSSITGITVACIGSFNYSIESNPYVSNVIWSVTGPNSSTDWSISPIIDPETGVADRAKIFWGSTPGPHTITVTTSNNCGGPVKTQTLVVNVDFSFKPVAEFIGASQYVCLPSSGAVTVDYTVNAAGTVFWGLEGKNFWGSEATIGTLTSSGKTATVTWSGLGVGTLYATVKTSRCEGEKTPFQVNVNPIPNAGTITVSKTSVCPLDVLQITMSGNEGFPICQIRKFYFDRFGGSWWSGWQTLASGSNSINYSVPFNDFSTSGPVLKYQFRGTTGGGSCAGFTEEVTVDRNSLPSSSLTSSDFDNIICSGDNVTFTASGGISYNFMVNGTSVQDGSGATYSTSSLTNGQNVSVVVTNTSGCSQTSSSIRMIVNPTPVPGLTSNDADNIICASRPVIFTATGGTTYDFMVNGTSVQNSSETTYSTTTVLNGQQLTVKVGNSSLCYKTSSGITMTVNPLPNVTVTPSTSAICQGSLGSSLTASGALTYTWSPPIGLSSSTGATVTANPSATTTYTITGVDSNGCAGAKQTIITVNPLPIISVTSSDLTICQNGSGTNLTASGASTYSWSPTAGLSATTGVIVTANPTSTTTYTVTGTDANGCTSNNAQVTITVNNASPGSITGSQTICAGGNPTNFSSTIAGSGAGALSYQWKESIDDITYTDIVGATGLTYDVPAGVLTQTTHYVRVITSSLNGVPCTATTTKITVTVNPLPAISVTPSAPSKCAGSGHIVLSASGAASYIWSPPTGLNTTTNGNVQANPTSTIAYTVSGLGANGCSGSASVTVTVHPKPTVTTANKSICSGQSVDLNLTSDIAGTTYSWSVLSKSPAITGTTVGATGTTNPISHVLTNSGTVVYRITPIGSLCQGNYKDVTVTVNGPSGMITQIGDLCQNGYVTLATKKGVGGYIWSTGDNTAQIIVYDPGTYSVTYTSTLGCSVSDTITVARVGSPCIYARIGKGQETEQEPEVEEVEEIKTLGVYPNPANETITVQFPEEAVYDLEVNLISQFGQQVGSSSIKKGETKTSLDARNLANGVYIVVVRSAQGVFMREKVMVQHR